MPTGPRVPAALTVSMAHTVSTAPTAPTAPTSSTASTPSGGSTLLVLIINEESTYTWILSSTNNPFLRHLYLNQRRY